MLVIGVAPENAPGTAEDGTPAALPNGCGMVVLPEVVPLTPPWMFPCGFPWPAIPGIGYEAAGGVAERTPDAGGAAGAAGSVEPDPPKVFPTGLEPPPGINGWGDVGAPLPNALGGASLNEPPEPPNVGGLPCGNVPGGNVPDGAADGLDDPMGGAPPGKVGIEGGCGS